MEIKKENRKKVLIYLTVVVLFFGLVRVLFFEKKEFDYETKTDPAELVDIALDMEEEFNLEDIRIIEAKNNILEVRLPTPTDVSKDTLMAGTAYMLGYLEPRVGEAVKRIRIIFTINYLDAMFIEVEVKNIEKWLKEKISDEEFIEKFRIVRFY